MLVRLIPVSWTITGWLCLALFAACGPSAKAPQEQVKPPILQKTSRHNIPSFEDDLDLPSLKLGVERSLKYYDRLPQERSLAFGDWQVSVGTLRDSLAHFAQLLASSPQSLQDPEFLAREFDLFLALGSTETHRLLITGYYEPVLQGSLKQDATFRYPLYKIPPDLLTIELARFDEPRYGDERLVGRVEASRVVPYYTRDEIDAQGKLNDSNSQLVWLEDPIAAFFLHVQGSGMINLVDGSVRRVGYAGANGRPYRSIGKLLIDQGAIPREEVSLQTIRAYLREHPRELQEVLRYNESYVFFRWVEEGPLGNLAFPITPGRSIATDQHYYPKGGLAFLVTEQPRLDEAGRVLGWHPLHRWVLSQDTGGAIRGPGRIDLFCGTGVEAEDLAGRLKQPGTVYFLLKKGSVLKATLPAGH
jgi:membrane-bound lytic murein transglycosylase A